MRVTLRVEAIDHVAVVAASTRSPLAGLLGEADVACRPMPSGVQVGRFGPGAALELVAPYDPENPIAGFLDRRGPGLHHIALRVSEPLAQLQVRLEASGIQTLGEVEPSADGRPSLFLHPRATGGVLVELVEEAMHEV